MNIIKKNGYSVAVNGNDFDIGGCVLALGNFDGVHLAHKELLKRAIEIKSSIGAKLVGAWSFEENPLCVLTDNPPPFIYNSQTKAEIMLSMGIDFVILCDFKFFKDMSPEDFVETHLIGELGCIGAVCGFNYSFGKFGAGKPELLKKYFADGCFSVVEEYKLDRETVSSTKIRKYILDGNVQRAAKMLGRPFSIVMPVVFGKQLGRTINFPTANQNFPKGSVIPKIGIYATRCTDLDGKQYIGVTNVGVRPTVDNNGVVNAETYILDFNSDIYGQNLKIEFIAYLRDEKKHSSLSELSDSISNDAKIARDIVNIGCNEKRRW